MIETALFDADRHFLFALAYRLTGLAGTAEELVAEALGRAGDDPSPAPPERRAHLSAIVARSALDRARTARLIRERYTGPWLPEPVLTAASLDEEIAVAESGTIGFLVLLEALHPAERAVLLLRDVFEYEYDALASTLGLTPANCRQLLHRARKRVGARHWHERPDPERQRLLAEQFVAAAAAGEPSRLARLLRADVTYTADTGGKAASLRSARGLDSVVRLFTGSVGRGSPGDASLQAAPVNHEAGFLAWQDHRLESVWVFATDADHVTAIRTISNPSKLRFIARQVATAIL